MLALLAALSLSLGPEPMLSQPSETLHLLDGAGGEIGAGRSLAFVGLGALAAGGSLLVALPLVSAVDGPAGSVLLLIPVMLTVAAQVGLGALFDVPVGWLSASVGTAMGIATGFALAFVLARTATPSGGFGDIGLAVLGVLFGYAVGVPLFTLLDPFGLSPNPEDEDRLVFEARPSHPGEGSRRDGGGTQLVLFAGRF